MKFKIALLTTILIIFTTSTIAETQDLGEFKFKTKNKNEETVFMRLYAKQVLEDETIKEERIYFSYEVSKGEEIKKRVTKVIDFKDLRFQEIDVIQLASTLLEREGRIYHAPSSPKLLNFIMKNGKSVFAPEVSMGTTFGPQTFIPFKTYVKDIERNKEILEDVPEEMHDEIRAIYEQLDPLLNSAVNKETLKKLFDSIQSTDKKMEEWIEKNKAELPQATFRLENFKEKYIEELSQYIKEFLEDM